MGLDTVSTPKDEAVYAKEETTFGTGAYPVGTDFVPIFGDGVVASFEQPKAKFDDKQKKMTVSQLSRLPGGFSPGTFSFPMYIKPSGALGTPIKGASILKAAFGKQTTTPATSDLFTLGGINDDIVGVTLVHRCGHRVTWNFGCVVNKVTFPIKAGNVEDALGQVQVEGFFCKQVQAGYDFVNGALSPGATAIVVDDERSFESGARIRFRNASTGAIIDDNAGAGFLISAVTAATHTITISTGLINAVADNSIVDAFVPTPSDAGSTVHGRLGLAQECLAGGSLANITIIDGQFEIDNGFKIKDDEKTGTWWPTTRIRAGNRKVTVSVNKIYDKSGATYFYESKALALKHLMIPVGDTAANRYRIDVPTVDFDTPKISGGDELNIGRTGIAVASAAYDDEISMIFD